MTSEITSLSAMDSETLGGIVQDRASGLGIKMRDLKPFILEIWRRLEEGETICGCRSKKQFADKIFNRTQRSVQLLLAQKEEFNEAKWADKPKSLNDEERYKRLYNFVDKRYADDFKSLERDIERVLRAQQRFTEIAGRPANPKVTA